MIKTDKAKCFDPLNIGFFNDWDIFKMDTKAMCDKQSIDTVSILSKVVGTSIKWKNNLFSPIGLTFKNGKALAVEASVKKFESDQERSSWLKKARPLIYCVVNESRSLYSMETFCSRTFDPIEPLKIQHTYSVRYFSHAGKLSWVKYKLQFLIGEYNFKYINPFLYRYLMMD